MDINYWIRRFNSINKLVICAKVMVVEKQSLLLFQNSKLGLEAIRIL